MTIETKTDYFDLKMTGLTELQAQLKQLPEEIARKLYSKIFKTALRAMEQEAISRVPVGETGNLANSIRVRVSRRGGWISARLVASAPHAHLLEYGHQIRKIKDGPSIGFVPPKPFLRPALELHSEAAINQTIEGLKEFCNE